MEAEQLCNMAVMSIPVITQTKGFEATLMACKNVGLSLSGSMAEDIIFIPFNSTPKESKMTPKFFLAEVFDNMKKNIPTTATNAKMVVVDKRSAVELPTLERLKSQPVAVVPILAPIIMGIPCLKVIIPEFTNPTTIMDVAEDD